jgi:hypothetical protein
MYYLLQHSVSVILPSQCIYGFRMTFPWTALTGWSLSWIRVAFSLRCGLNVYYLDELRLQRVKATFHYCLENRLWCSVSIYAEEGVGRFLRTVGNRVDYTVCCHDSTTLGLWHPTNCLGDVSQTLATRKQEVVLSLNAPCNSWYN